MIIAAAYYALLIAATIATFVRGDRWMRCSAAVMIVATALTAIATVDIDPAFAALNARLVLIDGCAFGALAVVACRSSAFWPMWAAALQLLAVAGSIVPWLDEVVNPLPYAISEQFWAWPLLILLIVMSFWRHRLHAWMTKD